jgi:hypothetical protein
VWKDDLVGELVGVNVGTNADKVIMLLRQDSNLTAKTIAPTLGLTGTIKSKSESFIRADEI